MMRCLFVYTLYAAAATAAAESSDLDDAKLRLRCELLKTTCGTAALHIVHTEVLHIIDRIQYCCFLIIDAP